MTKATDDELRGRLMALETIVVTLAAHMAAHTSDPVLFTAQVMDDVERALRNAEETAPKGMEKTARYAVASFEALSAGMLAHLNRYAVPQGKG
jgi:hypothetical protein